MPEQSDKLPPAIGSALARIAANNTSGAAEILRMAGTLFALLSSELSLRASLTGELAQQAVVDLSTALVQSQPDMSPLLKLASTAVTEARKRADAVEALSAAARAATEFVEAAARAAHATASRGAGLIAEGSRILTHSRSSTVLESFLQARQGGRQFSVLATESRPVLEGRAVAETLARAGVPVTLIADAAAAVAIQNVDLVVVGADKVTPDSLVNKIGTRLIALAAREKGVPAYSLCDTSKFVKSSVGRICDARDESELWPNPPPDIRVVNQYFEPTPLTYFTGIVTERGQLTREEASSIARTSSIDGALLDSLEKLGLSVLR